MTKKIQLNSLVQPDLVLHRWRNRLRSRFPAAFFQSLPQMPAVYRMFDRTGKLLYVGKALNLRQRLGSYRYIHPRSHPPRLVRLVGLVHTIRWEACADEASALLLENALLRECKPPFNVLNTVPESYGYLGFADRPEGLAFAWALRIPEEGSGTPITWFGAFRSRHLARQGYCALLRLQWWAMGGSGNPFRMPQALLRHRPVDGFLIPWSPALSPLDRLDWSAGIFSFLCGNGRGIIEELAARPPVSPTPLVVHWAARDLEILARFYDHALVPLRRLRRLEGVGAQVRPLAQARVDDLNVRTTRPLPGTA